MKLLGLVAVGVLLMSIAEAQLNLLPNPSFEEGAAAPADWKLSAEEGGFWAEEGRTGQRAIAVEGDGKDSVYWSTDAVQFEPGKTYQLSCWMRTPPGTAGGTSIKLTVWQMKKPPRLKSWLWASRSIRKISESKIRKIGKTNKPRNRKKRTSKPAKNLPSNFQLNLAM